MAERVFEWVNLPGYEDPVPKLVGEPVEQWAERISASGKGPKIGGEAGYGLRATLSGQPDKNILETLGSKYEWANKVGDSYMFQDDDGTIKFLDIKGGGSLGKDILDMAKPAAAAVTGVATSAVGPGKGKGILQRSIKPLLKRVGLAGALDVGASEVYDAAARGLGGLQDVRTDEEKAANRAANAGFGAIGEGVGDIVSAGARAGMKKLIRGGEKIEDAAEASRKFTDVTGMEPPTIGIATGSAEAAAKGARNPEIARVYEEVNEQLGKASQQKFSPDPEIVPDPGYGGTALQDGMRGFELYRPGDVGRAGGGSQQILKDIQNETFGELYKTFPKSTPMNTGSLRQLGKELADSPLQANQIAGEELVEYFKRMDKLDRKPTFADLQEFSGEFGKNLRGGPGTATNRTKASGRVYKAIREVMTQDMNGKERFMYDSANDLYKKNLAEQKEFMRAIENTESPEKAFKIFENSIKGQDATKVNRILRAMPKEQRKAAVDTYVSRLGRTPNGEFDVLRFANDAARLNDTMLDTIMPSKKDQEAFKEFYRMMIRTNELMPRGGADGAVSARLSAPALAGVAAHSPATAAAGVLGTTLSRLTFHKAAKMASDPAWVKWATEFTDIAEKGNKFENLDKMIRHTSKLAAQIPDMEPELQGAAGEFMLSILDVLDGLSPNIAQRSRQGILAPVTAAPNQRGILAPNK